MRGADIETFSKNRFGGGVGRKTRVEFLLVLVRWERIPLHSFHTAEFKARNANCTAMATSPSLI